ADYNHGLYRGLDQVEDDLGARYAGPRRRHESVPFGKGRQGRGLGGGGDGGIGHACHVRPQQRSKMPAAPMPVPTHMVTMPYRRSWRRRAWMAVAERIAPVAPSGWPRAMAPPMGLTTASSRPRSRITARAWAANSSFSSIQPIWSNVSPAFLMAAGMASLGPMPMISGGTP